MPIYSWPANLAKNDDVWITSLVDWPSIAAIGDTAEASVLAACSELSIAIQLRISDGLNVPLQSEPKPGQIQIPIDADASASLEAYVVTMNEKRFRQQSEIDQANRERRASYLSEFRISLDSVERLRDQTNQGATEFASIAIKSVYLLNGGALVAIPAILQIKNRGDLANEIILGAVISFFIGIFLAAVTNYLAYRSMFRAGNGHDKEIEARVIEVKNSHYPPEDPSIGQTRVVAIRSEAEGILKKANRLADFGVITFALSVLTFLVGVGVIIYGLGID